MARRNFVLRPARTEDAPRIWTAYQRWNDQNVLPRPEKDYQAAAEQGLFFIVEDGAEIFAGSGVFDLRSDSFVESGSTYVSEELRGHGLQKLFFEIRVATTIVMQGPDVAFTTAVNPTNLPSRKNTVKAGFELMDHPIPEQISPCRDCPKAANVAPPRSCCCDFYVLPLERRRVVVADLLARLANGSTIQLPGRATSIEIRVAGRLAEDPDFRIALEEFAAGKKW